MRKNVTLTISCTSRKHQVKHGLSLQARLSMLDLETYSVRHLLRLYPDGVERAQIAASMPISFPRA
jgi:hypothetical protein